MPDGEKLEISTKRRWKDQRGDTYVLITASINGGNSTPMTIDHYLHPGVYPSILRARTAGFRDLDRSDDFNIGVVRDGQGLAAILWMDEIVDDDPAALAEIAAEIGLPFNG